MQSMAHGKFGYTIAYYSSIFLPYPCVVDNNMHNPPPVQLRWCFEYFYHTHMWLRAMTLLILMCTILKLRSPKKEHAKQILGSFWYYTVQRHQTTGDQPVFWTKEPKSKNQNTHLSVSKSKPKTKMIWWPMCWKLISVVSGKDDNFFKE